MSNDYYNHDDGYPAFGAQGASSAMRAQLDKIDDGFDKLCPLTGNGLKLVRVNAGGTAQEAVSTIGGGTSPVAATAVTGTGTTAVFSVDPTFTLTDTTTNDASTSQHGWMKKFPGGTTIFLNGAGNFTSIPGASLTLLATLTPTVAAAVNALTTFSSTYDSYLIIGEDIAPATDAAMVAYFAVAGVLDTAASYATTTAFSSTAATYATSGVNLTPSATVGASGGGANFMLQIDNVNAASRLKSMTVNGCYDNATPSMVHTRSGGGYKGGVATGIGFAWGGGVNFKAQGSIRIYGIQKV